MSAEKFLLIGKRLCLSFRNLRGFYLVPIVYLYGFVPLLNFLTISQYGVTERAFTIISADMQKYIPFMSAWWVIFILKEYVEGDGCEVLYVYKSRMTLIVLSICLWYVLHISILMLIYSCIFTNIDWGLVRLAAQSLFFTSMAYFFVFLFRSISIPLMLVFLGEMIFFFGRFPISIFSPQRAISIAALSREIWVLGAAILFTFLGDRLCKHYMGLK